MKKMLIVSCMLVMSSMAFAGPVEGVHTMSPAEARAAVEKSPTFKMIEEKREKGVDVRSDRAMMDRITKVVDLNLNGVVSLGAEQKSDLIKLLVINPSDIMTEIARLASIAKDPANASNAHTREMAATSLRLMAEAGNNVQSLVLNSAEARRQESQVKSIIDISNKISSLNFGEASKTFVEKYEKALQEGKSVEDAIKIASNGKFSSTELRDCE
ncbi:MAG: hypothetical protein ACXWQQ_09195 [Pseudobdellovibrio sp.]